MADETPTEEVTPEAAVAAEPAPAATETQPTALDILNQGIEDGQAPRRVQPKAEDETSEDTRPRNADGTFKSESEEEKAAREKAELEAKETPDEKTAREKAEADAAAKADPLNDPVPDGLNKRTAERMKYLIDTVKQQGEVGRQHEELFGAITRTGATPDEFSAMLSYMALAHAQDAPSLERAYQMLQSELRGVAIRLGKPLGEVDFLSEPENADLVEDVRNGAILLNRAQELAVLRAQQKSTAARAQTTQAAEQNRVQQETTLANARADLDKLDTELRARDGDALFDAKYDVLVPMLQGLFQRLDPREWRAVFTDQYNKLNVPAPMPAAVAEVPPVPAERPMPMRPKTPAGSSGALPAPKSALDAINQALGGA